MFFFPIKELQRYKKSLKLLFELILFMLFLIYFVESDCRIKNFYYLCKLKRSMCMVVE